MKNDKNTYLRYLMEVEIGVVATMIAMSKIEEEFGQKIHLME